MTTINIVLGIVLIVASIALTITVLLQHGKSHNLSGTIAGGAETFFGKSKADTVDKKLNTITTVLAIVFVIIVLAVFLIQDSTDTSGLNSDYTAKVTAAVTDEAPADTTVADTSAANTTAADTTVADTTAVVTEAVTTVAE